MRRTLILSAFLFALGCGSGNLVVRTAEDAGFRHARIERQNLENPASLGCSSGDAVGYRLRGAKNGKAAYVTVCCGPERNGCEAVDSIGGL